MVKNNNREGSRMGKEICFYSLSRDEERLIHESIDECLADWWYSLSEVPKPTSTDVITVYGWRRAKVEPCGGLAPLEWLLETLDEEFGDPDGYHTQPEEALSVMQAAEREFLRSVCDAYESWMCEECAEYRVTVRYNNDGFEKIACETIEAMQGHGG